MSGETSNRIILIFVDGIGIGTRNQAINPCANADFRIFRHFKDELFPKETDSGIILGLDATLGIPGLPQSATGQTTLLTGINAGKAIDRHLSGFPNKRLRELVSKNGLFAQLLRNNKTPAFINTFRPPFFDYNPFEIERFLSTTTLINLYARLPFFSLDDLFDERSIYHDLTNETLVEKGFSVQRFTPEKAGQILAKQSRHYDIILYEYFQTDQAGHSQDFALACEKLTNLHRFLIAVLDSVNLEQTLVVLVSDHGNIEDLSIKTHTVNPVLTGLFGRGKESFIKELHSLVDITPAILNYLVNSHDS
jgi:2,3-bisphosphoglycerate-independent phosphoglycerate mutase